MAGSPGASGSASPPTAAAPAPSLSAFICYRREDSAGFARALKTVLSERYGRDRIFMDLDNISPGQLWEDVVNAAVSGCDVLIALIGPSWLTIQDESGRPRLVDANDPVRLELESALREKLKIIPVLLEGAAMPRKERLPDTIARLPGIEALSITDDWDAGVAKLVATLDRMVDDTHGVEISAASRSLPVISTPEHTRSDTTPHTSRGRPGLKSKGMLAMAAVVLAALIGGGIVIETRSNGHADPTLAYVQNVASVLARSGAERLQVRDAIHAKDAAALSSLQQRRADLVTIVEGWTVPSAARATNDALVIALRDSATADGRWASYAEGRLSYAAADSYETVTVHAAKFRFDELYDELLATVDGGPSPVPTNFLF